MAEYLIQGETLTNMADEIRTLSGTTGTMNPNEMAGHVSDANDAVDSQEDLIAQISAALEGKAVGGGGNELPTCTVTVIGNNLSDGYAAFYTSTNGVSSEPVDYGTTRTDFQCVIPSIFCVHTPSPYVQCSGSIVMIEHLANTQIFDISGNGTITLS